MILDPALPRMLISLFFSSLAPLDYEVVVFVVEDISAAGVGQRAVDIRRHEVSGLAGGVADDFSDLVDVLGERSRVPDAEVFREHVRE